MFDRRLYRGCAIAIIIAMMVGCGIQEPEQQNPLQQKIKTELKWLADYNSKNKISIISFKEYDRAGNLLTGIEYDKNGSLLTSSEYIHNGNTSREEKTYYDKNGAIDSSILITHEFNSDGKLLKLTVQYPDGSIISITQFDYDLHGNLIKKVQLNPDSHGRVETSFNYSFNGEGKVVERYTDLNSDGAIDTRDSVYYINNSRTVGVVSFDSDGFIQNTHTFQYNSTGLIISETVTADDNTILEYYIYEYSFYRD